MKDFCARMLYAIQGMRQRPPHERSVYVLGDFSDKQLALVEAFINSFANPLADDPKGTTKAAAAIKANLTREDILKEAIEVTKARGLKYGAPENNFARIARHWRVYFQNRFDVELPIGSRDVALLMDLMKTARLENEITHHDSWVDKAGYAACGAVIREEVEPERYTGEVSAPTSPPPNPVPTQPEWFHSYCGLNYEQCSRAGERLISEANKTGAWHKVLDQLIFLRGQMGYLKDGQQ